MGKRSNIVHQMKKELQRETKYGQSKYKDKQEVLLNKERGEDYQQVRGIYSTTTYNCYDKSCTHFIHYVLEHHHEVKSYSDCKEYVEEYLNNNIERGLSA
ncbi:MAG: hypothetical protein ACLUVC_13200 [Longibaculum sp.]